MPVDPVCGIEMDEVLHLFMNMKIKNIIFAVMVAEEFS